MQSKFKAITDHLNKSFKERQGVSQHLVAALLGQHHVWIFGPPGTGKSAMISELTKCIEGATVFDRLCNSDLKAEDFFGPVKMSALKNDRYERAIDGFLPQANIAFLDEGGRTSGRVRDQLLRVMNERYFNNGGTVINCPLVSMFSGSNQLLTNAYDEAFVDRFLVTISVGFIKNSREFQGLIQDQCSHMSVARTRPSVTLAELEQAQNEVKTLPMAADFLPCLMDLRDALSREGVAISDRRWVAVVNGLKAFAWLSGSSEVRPEHMEWAIDMLWKKEDERRLIAKHIGSVANPSQAMAAELEDSAHAHLKTGTEHLKAGSIRKAGAANVKLKQVIEQLSKLKEDNPASHRISESFDKVTDMRLRFEADLKAAVNL